MDNYNTYYITLAAITLQYLYLTRVVLSQLLEIWQSLEHGTFWAKRGAKFQTLPGLLNNFQKVAPLAAKYLKITSTSIFARNDSLIKWKGK